MVVVVDPGMDENTPDNDDNDAASVAGGNPGSAVAESTSKSSFRGSLRGLPKFLTVGRKKKT